MRSGRQGFARAVQSEDPALAQEHDQIALHRDPGDVLERGQVQDGMAELELAAQRSPDRAVVQFWLAHAHRRTGARENAARASTRAAELDPRNPGNLDWAAWNRQARGDHAAALGWLEALAEPANRRPDRALPLFERCLESRPAHGQAWYDLALAYRSRGDSASAARSIEETLRLSPGCADCRYDLAECHEGLGQPDRAALHRAAFEEAVRARRAVGLPGPPRLRGIPDTRVSLLEPTLLLSRLGRRGSDISSVRDGRAAQPPEE